ADAVAIADPEPEVREAVASELADAVAVASLDELLELELDGIVIATPSAMHAEQAVAALERGLPVFCQKPLGRNAAETARVVAAARMHDVLLGVDLSYRHTRAMQAIAERVRAGELGRVHAIRLTFHNAYGPDKPWFYRKCESGGGCVIDLGTHLVDLAAWVLGFPALTRVSSRLTRAGEPIGRDADECEDHALAQLEFEGGCVVQLACSWRSPAGRDAVIDATFHGIHGGATLRNVDGSFYDFVAELHDHTRTEVCVEPPDAWGGRAAIDWAARLAAGQRFDPAADEFVRVAELLDAIYSNEVIR
ncbi:MAG TPA: Gfo/Idh/MocA family oxidoreductase, partial [Enhygromyxa sp.]|nr:Gfo/Idh/MocA family oxidoreductase [Enhygromyxa sp.]